MSVVVWSDKVVAELQGSRLKWGKVVWRETSEWVSGIEGGKGALTLGLTGVVL